ncbi:unnamed protein product, partial [Mesorhabditis spiculigera]
MSRVFVPLLVLISVVMCAVALTALMFIPESGTLASDFSEIRGRITGLLCPKYAFLRTSYCFENAECRRVGEGDWKDGEDLIKFFACYPKESRQIVNIVLFVFGGYLVAQMMYDLINSIHTPLRNAIAMRRRKEFIV